MPLTLPPMKFQQHPSFDEIPAQAWNTLLGAQDRPTPFLRWEFLHALEATGCTTGETGWQPLPITVTNNAGELVAAAPLYAKGHSYGEYVFDWAWADAYERAGYRYFPKLLIASPFSPIPGTRLLATDALARDTLLSGISTFLETAQCSSAHILFPESQELNAARAQDWLVREAIQFHWQNLGFHNFDDYLASLTQPKRKKVKAERRKVREAGIECTVKSGRSITEADWAFFFECYRQTYDEHRSTPYLNLDFFLSIAESMPETLALCIASRHETPIASALLMHEHGVAYGRYWGAIERVDCLHFEVAYYTPIEWAIGMQFKRFEGGAQGAHKLARGFTPVKTYSAHLLREPRYREAIRRYLERESQGIAQAVEELEQRSPLRPEQRLILPTG